MTGYWIGWSAASWGTSWGDIPVEEYPERVGGRGKRSRGGKKQAGADNYKQRGYPTVEEVEKAWELLEAKRTRPEPKVKIPSSGKTFDVVPEAIKNEVATAIRKANEQAQLQEAERAAARKEAELATLLIAMIEAV